LPRCTITTRNGQAFDSCASIGSNRACELDSGVCGGPPPGVDAGDPDAGPAPDPELVLIAAATDQLGALNPQGGGCGCDGAPGAQVLLGSVLLLAARRRSRKSTSSC